MKNYINQSILFLVCICLSTLVTYAQPCNSATDLGGLDPCLSNQEFTINNADDSANNLGSCGFDGDDATWVCFTLVAPSTGVTIDVADWGGCSGFACATDITGALYASADGTCGTLSAVDDCIDFTGGFLNGTSNGPFIYNSLAPGKYFLRLSEEDDQGGSIELQIHGNPLPGDSPTNPVDLATANGIYCNFTATGNDCTGANDANSCIGSVDNTIFYSFTVDASTPQPVEFGLENIICDGNLQMVVVTADCSASVGSGGNCGVGTGDPAPQLTENLPPGDYLLVVDGFAGDDCSWGLTTNIPPPGCAIIGTPTLTPGACVDPGTPGDTTDDTFTVTLDIDFADATSAAVTLDGAAMTSVNTMTTTGGVVQYTITLPADGSNQAGVIVVGDGSGACTVDLADFTAPGPCSTTNSACNITPGVWSK